MSTETRDKVEALAAFEAIVSDFFTFQAAACTSQPDCDCGRGPEWHCERNVCKHGHFDCAVVEGGACGDEQRGAQNDA